MQINSIIPSIQPEVYKRKRTGNSKGDAPNLAQVVREQARDFPRKKPGGDSAYKPENVVELIFCHVEIREVRCDLR